jgi:hypothetical protein
MEALCHYAEPSSRASNHPSLTGYKDSCKQRQLKIFINQAVSHQKNSQGDDIIRHNQTTILTNQDLEDNIDLKIQKIQQSG